MSCTLLPASNQIFVHVPARPFTPYEKDLVIVEKVHASQGHDQTKRLQVHLRAPLRLYAALLAH